MWLCIACNVRVDYLFGEQWTQTTSKWGHPYPPNTPILGACGASFLAPSVIDLAPIQTSWIRHCLPCDRRRSYSANTGHDLDRPVTLDMHCLPLSGFTALTAFVDRADVDTFHRGQYSADTETNLYRRSHAAKYLLRLRVTDYEAKHTTRKSGEINRYKIPLHAVSRPNLAASCTVD